MATLTVSPSQAQQFSFLPSPLTSNPPTTTTATATAANTASDAPPITTQTTPQTLTISLQNNTPSTAVYAYITGQTLSGTLYVLSSTGTTPFFPPNPITQTLTPIPSSSISIALGPPGLSRAVTIPRLAGARIWFSVGSQLQFFLNPISGAPQDGQGRGVALVEPSVMNESDTNYDKEWGFAEFTFNEYQLFGNVSMVDFVGRCPVSLGVIRDLPTDAKERQQEVEGMGYGSGLDRVVESLRQVGGNWEKLVIRRKQDGLVTRVLSPNSAVVMGAQRGERLFQGYYDGYVRDVWEKYRREDLVVDTQNKWGVVRGRVDSGTNLLTFPIPGSGTGGKITFGQPSAADIFSCSTGPFAFPPLPPNPTETDFDVQAFRGNVGARLAAAFNRSTLLINPNQPAGEQIGTFYKSNSVTNHYSRVVHENSPGGRGYAFPYDDVSRTEEENVAGTVAAGNPKVFVVAVGGGKVNFAALGTAVVESEVQTAADGAEKVEKRVVTGGENSGKPAGKVVKSENRGMRTGRGRVKRIRGLLRRAVGWVKG
ncbi:hypothetical protein SMACR_05339 [Sordaria macrospora]|uniref:WGS project CABT00000000 data, contig 2.25 n=2 Tax=Sordaria macrospora TaxID=5147 RepID=F7W3L1_SORMK|nr:uncharacterized protein SMAC_05339 [Sordaria macrospora k-hell]KAA8633825.1 hypothetical protein SMACR_05339 [Sordaria macrospora]KAH7632079.1 hypothetical protein B0T09DRAFT_114410 [Sordaria sp. MPI-SDFR-AT-0083]WPJ63371.1 hypothetical protein SMAC4_05339 [Sordaria macrospora]CCC12267.1 unnamed protein product [Sordaria macrospora k-hell]